MVVALLLLSNGEIHAQWKRLATFSEKVLCIYFTEYDSVPIHGFVSTGGVSDALNMTTDGGKTWASVAHGHNAVSMFFKDALTGWCVDRGSYTYATNDGGLSWISIPSPQGFGVYYNRKSGLLIETSWGRTVATSPDNGVSWTSAPGPTGTNGIAFFRDSVGFASSVNSPASYRTTDAGVTWVQNQFHQECWQPHVSLPSGTFYNPGEATGRGLWKSTDGGLTWFLATQVPAALVGHMQGDDCRLYVHTTNGVYRSLDSAHTWQFIGGPPNTLDTRALYVRGKEVFAGGSDGSLWYLNDTVPDPRELRILTSIASLRFDTVVNCAQPTMTVQFANYRMCDSLRIENISLKSLVNPSFAFTTAPQTPFVLPPGSADSLTVQFQSKGIGKFNSSLHITFLLDGRLVDTVLPVSGVHVQAGQSGLSTYSLNFDTISLCQNTERTVSITNNNCDSASIELSGLPSSDFTVISPTLPYSAGPGEKVTIVVQYTPQTTGGATSYLLLKLQPRESPSQTFQLDLEGAAEQRFTIPSIQPPAIDFGTLSVCDTTVQTAAINFIDPSKCDSVKIRIEPFSDSGFLLLNTPGEYPLGADSSITIAYSFHAPSKGRITATIPIEFYNGTTWVDSTISATAFVTDGTKILSSSTNTLDFGTTTLCNEKDTSITLRNTGCDTLMLTAVTGLTAGFSVDTTFPIVIASGGSVSIPISTHRDTTGGQLQNTATLGFTSTAVNTIAPITLTRSYSLPGHYSFHLASNGTPQATAGGKVIFSLIADQPILLGVTTIDYDLALNTDLLGFSQTSGPNQVNVTGNHTTITGNPNIVVASDGSVATFEYNVFLTKDSTTDLTATNLHLNKTDPSFEQCVASASTSDTAFSYIFECADHELQQLMSTGVVRITSIQPNPTSSDVTLSIESPTKQQATIAIYDLLGKEVMTQHIDLLQGTTAVTLDASTLARSRYTVRVEAQSTSVTGSFVRE